MKRIIFSLIMLLSIIDIKAQMIGIEETDDSELVVRRTGKLNIYYTTIQFDLYLPNGMSLSVDKVKLASHLSNHELLTEDLGNGRMLFMIYSPQNEPLLGELLRLPIEVTLGENTRGAIKHIVLGTFDGISLPTDDISFSMGTAIQEQPVTITANDLTMTYGDDVPKLTYKSEGAELNGTPSLTTTATKTSPVGTYPITVTKGTVTNEQVTYVAGTLTITKAPLTVGVKNETITEGDAIPAFTLTYSGFRNSDTEATAFTTKPVAKTTATLSSPAGTYPITVSGGEAQNYALTYGQGTLTIEKKIEPVTITADNLTMTYGDNVPKLTYKSEGAELNGTPSLTTTATKTSPVGTYPITVTKGTVTNEQVTYVAGTLTITKAPLTVGVKNETITEGDAIPTFTLTYSGFRNSDTEATAFTTKPVAKTTATPSSAAGTYPITVSGGEAQNYSLTYGQGTLTIEEKEVDGVSSVKADEQPNTATYNLAGQKVNAQYKGIVIRNGKKVMK